MGYFRLLMGVCLLAGSMLAGAQPSVRVVGLFPNAALLNIDGQRTLVKAGKTGPQGVTVISADSRSAVLSIDGVQSTYTLTRDYGSGGFSAGLDLFAICAILMAPSAAAKLS